MKRLLAIFLCTAMLAGAFAACTGGSDTSTAGSADSAGPAGDVNASSGAPAAEGTASGDWDPNVNPAGVFPIVKEKVKLSAFVIQQANVSDMKDNEATRALEELTNIDLEFITAPMDGYKEKRSILLTSGDYPDMFLMAEARRFENEEVMMYGSKQKVFIPLNDLLEEYGDNIKKNIELTPEYLTDIITPDGNIYGLPTWEMAYHTIYSQKMWMNQSWLDKLGLSLPTTTDELYTVLKAFKEKDPNGNGVADEIPLTGAVKWVNGQPQDFIMNAFIYNSYKHYMFVQDDGHLAYAPAQEQWREGLRYMKKLYDEGLLDSGAFTQTMEQVKQLGTNPDNVLLGAVTTLHPGHFVTISDEEKDVRHKDYVAVPPLKGPDGTQYAMYNAGFIGACFVITDTCEYPEAAFRLGDYLSGEEGSLLVSEGVEGQTWRRAEEGELNILGEPATYTRLEYTHVAGQTHNLNWGYEVFRNRGSELNGLRGKWTYSQDVTTFDGYETRLFQETLNKYDGLEPEEVFTSVYLPVENTDDAFQLKVNIEDYVNQSRVRFITGDMDIDKDWDSYLQQLETLQLAQYIKIYDDAYQIKRSAA